MAWTETLPSGKYRGGYRLPTGQKRSAGTFTHKKAALVAAAAAERDAALPGWKDPMAGARKWGDWAPEWWQARDVTEATLKIELSAMKRIEAKWSKTSLADITRYDIERWAVALKKDGLEASTVNRYLNTFRASLSAAVKAGVLSTNPASGVHLEVGQKDVRRYLTEAEAKAVLEHLARPSDVPFAKFLFNSGARFGEAAGLQVNRLSASLDSVRIAETWIVKTGALAMYPKGRRIRTVPLQPSVADVLRPLVKGRKSGFVFANKHEEVIDYSNFRKRLVRAAENAGLGTMKVHDTRHTYASWLLQAGVSLAEVGRLLGHVDPGTTQIYAHLAPQQQEHIFAALPDL